MVETSPSLFLMSLRLDIRHGYAEAVHKRLPLRDLDVGYLVHCQLKGLFGELAPKPFFVQNESGPLLRVLGYTQNSKEALKAHSEAFAQPEAYSTCCWDTLKVKPMPLVWKKGMIVGFETVVCPVQRMAKATTNHAKGSEVDVFLAECWKTGNPDIPVNREEVYRRWLGEQLERLKGGSLRQASLLGFKRERFCRRTQGVPRIAHRTERPEAHMKGLVEITDSEAFASLLKRGIGRHRAFGFGMLLLRPAQTIC